MPTHQAWVQTINDDPDLRRITRAMKRENQYPHRADLKEPFFLEALQQGQLELDNDIYIIMTTIKPETCVNYTDV